MSAYHFQNDSISFLQFLIWTSFLHWFFLILTLSCGLEEGFDRDQKSVGPWWSCICSCLQLLVGSCSFSLLCGVSFWPVLQLLLCNFFWLLLILLAVDLTHYVFLVLCQSLMWCVCDMWRFFCRYGDNVAKAVLIVVSVVCVHFLLVGISLATICWWASFCILSRFPSFMVVLCILNSQTANLGNCKNQERLKNFN